MKAAVVYESLWGNTAAVARAIAEGIGPETRVLSTAEASPEAIAGVDLLVVGAPLIAFSAPSDSTIKSIAGNQATHKVKPDLSQPSIRTWLNTVPAGSAHCATFETRIWWSPGSAAGAIAKGLVKVGYRVIGKGQKFIVKGTYGPLRDGELEKAKAWGAELAQAVK